jgi:hypothetical protein
VPHKKSNLPASVEAIDGVTLRSLAKKQAAGVMHVCHGLTPWCGVANRSLAIYKSNKRIEKCYQQICESLPAGDDYYNTASILRLMSVAEAVRVLDHSCSARP